MRPLRVDLRGFTVFREATTVDLTDTDFFALVGPTGSGKSSILDSICFALYGTAPRWSGLSVANALAPSASEASVRLIFEAAGARYAVTRVVRRDGKGRATQRAAALQALSAGFDPSVLDSGDLLGELGEALAGTPTEVNTAIPEVIGLPYEQFVKCVVLPQGEFAAFLHAKPADRQDILVRLLGLSVYEKVRDRASELVKETAAQLAATEPVLAELETTASGEAVATAQEWLDRVRDLTKEVDAALPALAKAHEKSAGVTEALGEADRRLALLAMVRPPGDVASLAALAAKAAAASQDAMVAVGAAEKREEKVREQLESAPDPAALTRRLDAYAEREKAAAQLSNLDKSLAEVKSAFEAVEEQRQRAADAAEQAAKLLEQANEALGAAKAADWAAWIRRDLHAGEPCPVCEQQVAEVPAMPAERAMTAAKAAVDQAQAKGERALAALSEKDRAVRDAERKLAVAQGQREQLAKRVADVARVLEDAPDPKKLRSDLAAVEALRKELAEASGLLRAAREAQREAAAKATQAEERMRKGWRDFDGTRDLVAALAPPAPDRDDLAKAWHGLAAWAAELGVSATEQRERLRRDLDAAQAHSSDLTRGLDSLFLAVDLPRPRAGEHQRDATIAVERADGALKRLHEKRDQAELLRRQRAAIESERQVATALANHLRANNFEAWLLAEALDALVDGASGILRELSQGQYELIHDEREFFVVDHHDAGLRRGVRTLSGGETFQASLALALALADQLGGLSSTASLESIMLDEGFGTLDASTLDTVAATLENLAATGNRMVGVVTHVQSLAERIPVRFEISKDARSARVERIG